MSKIIVDMESTSAAKKPVDTAARIKELRKIIDSSQIELNDLTVKAAKGRGAEILEQLKSLKVKTSPLTNEGKLKFRNGTDCKASIKLELAARPTISNALAFVVLSESLGFRNPVIEIWKKIKEKRYIQGKDKVVKVIALATTISVGEGVKGIEKALKSANIAATKLADRHIFVDKKSMRNT